MANMDGSNIKILFQNQKEPVGKYFFIYIINSDRFNEIHVYDFEFNTKQL